MAAVAPVSGPAMLAAPGASIADYYAEFTKELTGTTSYLPEYLSANGGDSLVSSYPWGDWKANDTDYYWEWPETGVTRHYDFTVSHGPCAPDGYPMECYMVNNQVPGPLIEANWGDWIEVTVTNAVEAEGTSIHWHGFLQKGTSWMDGVPGVSQCPIAPGSSFTYRFQAQLYGSGWYHSHYDAQATNGAFGPIVVYGPRNAHYDEDLGPVMLSDWVHESYHDLIPTLMAPFPEQQIPPSQNNLINGLNPYVGYNANVSRYAFTSGKSYRLRLINAACSATQKFTIDSHTFLVIANDFVPIEPYETDHITLAVGQRSDVVVKAWMNPGSAVWMRSWIAPCSQREGQTEAKAAIYYNGADPRLFPKSLPGPNAYNEYCGNDDLALTTPFYPITPPAPSVESVIPITAQSNGTHLLWYMAGRTFRTNYNDPDLLEAKIGNLDFPYIENVHNYGSNSSIVFVVENTGWMPHPMHLHGHNMFILAEGKCDDKTVFGGTPPFIAEDNPDPYSFGSCWNGTVTNPHNPQRRDTQQLLPGHYIVVQWNQDNPGVWPFHCHLTWHGSAGFFMNLLERPDDVRQLRIPNTMAQTCREWADWTGTNVVDQLDDGL